MQEPIVFFSRCLPQDSDPIEIVKREGRLFIGYPAIRPGTIPERGKVRESVVDLRCSDVEWAANLPKDRHRARYTQNRNFAKKVALRSIALVPRPRLGVVFAGFIENEFELIDDPPWFDEYLRIRIQQGLWVDPEGDLIGDLAQTWKVDHFRPISFTAIPAWIRKSLFGRSTYGQIYGFKELDLDPYATLNAILAGTGRAPRQWTTEAREVERRLLDSVGPSTFEHLCVALLQLEHPDEIWTHIGGTGDGGVDGIGADEVGRPVGLLQCKWRYQGEHISFVQLGCTAENSSTRLILASLLHSPETPIPNGVYFWSREYVAKLVCKHSGRLPLAVSIRIG